MRLSSCFVYKTIGFEAISVLFALGLWIRIWVRTHMRKCHMASSHMFKPEQYDKVGPGETDNELF